MMTLIFFILAIAVFGNLLRLAIRMGHYKACMFFPDSADYLNRPGVWRFVISGVPYLSDCGTCFII